nr:hypothetical transcript [Hymenolepis microstoma]
MVVFSYKEVQRKTTQPQHADTRMNSVRSVTTLECDVSTLDGSVPTQYTHIRKDVPRKIDAEDKMIDRSGVIELKCRPNSIQSSKRLHEFIKCFSTRCSVTTL